MYVCIYRPRERESEAPNKTQRERERDLEEEEEEVGRVGLCSGAEERERENLMLVTVCCFASAYTTLLFCQLMMMMAVCFARGLSRGLAVTSFLKLIEKCVFLFFFFWDDFMKTLIYFIKHMSC